MYFFDERLKAQLPTFIDDQLRDVKYIAQTLSTSDQIQLTVGVELDTYSLLCTSPSGEILGYVHDENFPRKEEFELHQQHVVRKIVRLSAPFTLLPAAEFHMDMLERIAKEAFTFDKIEHIHYFQSGEIVGVYHVSSELKSKLIKFFPDFDIEHSVQPLLSQQSHQDPSILAHWTHAGLMLLAYHEGLQLANYYKIDSPEDAIYYILSAYKHVHLNPLHHPLDMSGRIAKDSVIFNKLAGFVRDFRWKEHPSIPLDFPFESHLFYHLT